MKINWNKIIAGVLITNSLTKEANAMNFNHNPNLEKTFEVAEVQSRNFAELGLVNQEFTNVHGLGEPIKWPGNPAECTEKLFEQLEICTAMFSNFPPALAICVAAAWGAYYLCMRL